jgi:hypothetical protein
MSKFQKVIQALNLVLSKKTDDQIQTSQFHLSVPYLQNGTTNYFIMSCSFVSPPLPPHTLISINSINSALDPKLPTFLSQTPHRTTTVSPRLLN